MDGKILEGFSVVKRFENSQTFLVQELSTGYLYVVKSIESYEQDFYQNCLNSLFSSVFVNPFLVRNYLNKPEKGYRTMNNIFMEYCEKGNLRQYVEAQNGKVGLLEFLGIFKQIVEGISVLHKNKTIHGNIKPENVLFTKFNEVKIADFINFKRDGEMENDNELIHIGSLVPPETIMGNELSYSSDIYSAGCMLYYIATGHLPFDGNRFIIPQKILSGEYILINRQDFPTEVLKLIYSMIAKDPYRRPTIEVLCGHPVINGTSIQLPPRMPVLPPPGSKSPQDYSNPNSSARASTSTSTHTGAGETVPGADPGTDSSINENVADIITEIGLGNLNYTPTDFRLEFEGIFDRKPTHTEIALFLKQQRSAKAKAASGGGRGSSKWRGRRSGDGDDDSDGDGDSDGDSDILRRRDFENYVFQKRIGGGAYGNVFLAQHRHTKAVRAIKIIALDRGNKGGGKSSSEQRLINGEIKIGTEFGKRCVFLVDYEQVTVRRGECFILMEYCSGGDLRQLLDSRMQEKQPFEENDILRFLVEIGLAIHTLHAEGIIHRDIKPQNVFLAKNGSYKLGDYGTARFLSDNTMSMAGTSGYIAPEILQGETHCVASADIYSLGCILFEMMELQHPFMNEKGNLNIVNVSLGKHNPIRRTQYSSALVGLVKRMISVDKTKRPSITEVLSFQPLFTFLLYNYASMKKKELLE